MWKEFKDFALKANALGLATGVIIANAVQKIVTSLVNDIIMPSVSILIGDINYSDLTFTIGDSHVKYGSFIAAIIDFLIIAFSLFVFVKYVNTINRKIEEFSTEDPLNLEKLAKKNKFFKNRKKKEKPKPKPTKKVCTYCFSEINIKATRCPNCTSELEVQKEKPNVMENQIEIE